MEYYKLTLDPQHFYEILEIGTTKKSKKRIFFNRLGENLNE